MIMAQIRVVPAELRSAAEQIEAAAQRFASAVETTDQQMKNLIYGGLFDGMRARELFARYQRMYPTMEAWPHQLQRFADMLQQAAQIFEEADQAQAGIGMAGTSAPAWTTDPNYLSVNEYANRTTIYQTDQLCAFYSAINLALLEGRIDLATAQKLRANIDHLIQYVLDHDSVGSTLKQWDVNADSVAEIKAKGFGSREAATILLDDYLSEYYDIEIDYEKGDFVNWMGRKDRDGASSFLVNQLSSGKPVQVSLKCNDGFGNLNGVNHMCNVVGIQMDGDRPVSVVVDLNGHTIEVSADKFMDAWLDANGEYIILT